jgi:hypothetical protein
MKGKLVLDVMIIVYEEGTRGESENCLGCMYIYIASFAVVLRFQ